MVQQHPAEQMFSAVILVFSSSEEPALNRCSCSRLWDHRLWNRHDCTEQRRWRLSSTLLFIIHPFLHLELSVAHLLPITTQSIINNNKQCLSSFLVTQTKAAPLLWQPRYMETQSIGAHQIHHGVYFDVNDRGLIDPVVPLTLDQLKRSDCLLIFYCSWVTLGRHWTPERGSLQPPSQVLIWCNGPLITSKPHNESLLCEIKGVILFVT